MPTWSGSFRAVSFGAAAVTAALLPAAAYADGLPSKGTILGVFSNVITTGIYLNSPALGQYQYVDNSQTAVYSITNSSVTSVTGAPPVQTVGSSLKWGTYPPGNGVSPEEAFSEINFFGGQIPSDIHEPFQLGTITFLNGTSILSSQIFGAQISFYDNVVSPETLLGTDTIYVSTTSNFYESTAQDADWFNICGNGSNLCDTQVKAVETYEGGTGVTVNLYGEIVGDPVLHLDSAVLAPGQTDDGNGFIATGRQMATSVPEPSTWAMLLLGMSAVGLFARDRRRSGSARA